MKHGCNYELDLDGQVTCTQCGAMDDDMSSSDKDPFQAIDIWSTQVSFEE